MFRKKIISITMAVCLLLSCSMLMGHAQALSHGNENQIGIGGVSELDFSYILTTKTALTISNAGVATGLASLQGFSGVTTSVTITMTLQQRGGFLNLFWNDVITWTQTFNHHSGTLTRTHNVSNGTFRIRATYVARSGSSSETVTRYSDTASH